MVAGDGTVYVGSASALYAVTPEGLLKWDYPARGAFFRVPAIGLDGTILVASSDTIGVATLHALTELDGSSGGYASAPWPKARGGRANTGRVGAP